MTGLFILLRSATKITHKAQAVTCLAAKWHACATLDSFDAATAQNASGRSLPVVVGSEEHGESDNEEVDVEEDELDNTKLIPSYAYSTISFQKRHALGKPTLNTISFILF